MLPATKKPSKQFPTNDETLSLIDEINSTIEEKQKKSILKITTLKNKRLVNKIKKKDRLKKKKKIRAESLKIAEKKEEKEKKIKEIKKKLIEKPKPKLEIVKKITKTTSKKIKKKK